MISGLTVTIKRSVLIFFEQHLIRLPDENTGLNVSQLYIAQVKRKHGLIERVNYNVGSEKSKVPQVPIEKEKAIEDALRHFKMI